MANPITEADIFKPTGEIDKAIKDLERLSKQHKETANDIEKRAINIKADVKTANAQTKSGQKKINDSTKLTQKLRKEQEALQQDYKNTSIRIKELKQVRQKQNKIQKLEIQRNNAAKGSYDRLSAEYGIAKMKLNAMSEAQRKNTKAGQRLEQQARETYEEMNRLQKATGKSQLGVGRYSEGVKNATKNMSAFIAKVTAATMAIRELVRGVTSLITVYSDFEQKNANLQAVTQSTNQTMKVLKDRALEVASSTKYTARQLTDMQTSLAKLGFTTKEINLATEGVANLAAATGEDLNESADIAAKTLRGFNLEASEMQRVVDVMSGSFTKSALNLNKFTNSMNKLAPVANNAGFSIEETTAMVGKLVDAGIRAETAGAQLRNIFLDLAKSGQSYESAMQEIRNATDQNRKALEMFNKRSAPIAQLLANNEEATKNFSKELENMGGISKKMAEQQMDTLQGSALKLVSAWEVLAVKIGDEVDGSLRGLIQALRQTVLWITENLDVIKSTIGLIVRAASVYAMYRGAMIASNVAIRASTAATKKDMTVKGLYRGVVQKATTATRALNTALKNNWFAIAVTAIYGVIQAYKAYKSYADSAKGSTEKYSEEVKRATKDLRSQQTSLRVLKDRLKETNYEIKRHERRLNEAKEGSAKYKVASKNLEEAESDRKDIINKLNNNFSDYLDNEISMKDTYSEIETKLENVNKQLEKRIALKATEKRREEAFKDLMEIYNKIDNKQKEMAKSGKALAEGNWFEKAFAIIRAKGTHEELNKLQKKYDETLEDYKEFRKKAEKIAGELNVTPGGEEPSPKPTPEPMPEPGGKSDIDMDDAMQDISDSLMKRRKKRMQIMQESRRKELKQLQLSFEEKKREWEKYGMDVSKLVRWKNKRQREINKKWDKKEQQRLREKFDSELAFFDKQQELRELQFENQKNSQAEKERFSLQMEKERLEKILELNKKYGGVISEIQAKIYKQDLKNIKKEINNITVDDTGGEQKDSLLAKMGFGKDAQKGLNRALDEAKRGIQNFMRARIQAANEAVRTVDKEVKAAEKAYQRQIDLAKAGYANNVKLKKKELEEKQEAQEKAEKRQKQAQERQRRIQSAMQASNLITASSKIWSQLGFPWAIPAIATMWGSFIAAKTKARQVTYGEGGLETVEGGSHQSGNDVNFGYTKDGKERKVEGGESIAVFNKRANKKYDLQKLVNEINAGEMADNYKANFVIQKENTVDTSKIENELVKIRKKENPVTFQKDGKTYVVQGNKVKKYA